MKKRAYILLPSIGLFIMILYFGYHYIENRKELNFLEMASIEGRIAGLRHLSRGSYSIDISVKDSVFTFDGLLMGYYVGKHGIVAGDSIAKQARSRDLYIFKNHAGSYKFLCIVPF